MTKYCTKCGNQLDESTKFCTKCGSEVAKVTPESAEKQGSQTAAPTSPSTMPSVASVKTGASIILGGGTLAASPVAGEIAVDSISPLSLVTNILNPFKTILSSVKRIISSFKNAFENKKGLIAAIVLAIVWIVLTLLPLLGVNPLPVKLASWLTFAQGGLKGGVLGFIGGIIGKGMFAGLIISLFSSGVKGASGLKKLFSGFKSGTVGMTLIGIGAALVLFNFMAGISTPIQSMAGVAGFMLAMKSLGGGGGFIRKLATSLTANKKGKIRTENTSKCTALLSGLSLGFAASAVISLIPWGYLPYCLGAAVIVAGVILDIVLGSKKEVLAK